MGKKILMLGSGMVTPAFLDHVLGDKDITVTIGAYLVDEANDLKKACKDPSRVSVHKVDVSKSEELDEYVSSHDVVVSLVPAPMHPVVAECCIKHKVNMATASYRSPQMMALDQKAKDAGILILNEYGLDPGMDHLSAVKVIRGVEKEGGKVLSFESWCGGLPAPEAADNPIGYKFSWNPRGVLRAAGNDAFYWGDNKEVTIPGSSLLRSARPLEFGDEFKKLGCTFEGYPNRDSRPYKEYYTIPDAATIVRGTVRYVGFCVIVDSWKLLGLFDETDREDLAEGGAGMAWRVLLAKVMGVSADANLEEEVIKTLESKPNPVKPSEKVSYTEEEKKTIIDGYKWFGLFSHDKVTPRKTVIDTLCAMLEDKLAYKEGERDMIVLQHRFKVERKDGRRELITSTCVDYGDKVYSSMAKTVGLPLAIAVLLMLDGTYSGTGVECPYTLEYALVGLEKLKELNIGFEEKVVPLNE